jgi:hypothetical protein
MPISSIFKPESLFWCQKLRLELLISDLFSEKFWLVWNIVKIVLEWSATFVFVKKNQQTKKKIKMLISSFFDLGRFFWCQKLRLELLISDLFSENF